jgi:hypothetical protein
MKHPTVTDSRHVDLAMVALAVGAAVCTAQHSASGAPSVPSVATASTSILAQGTNVLPANALESATLGDVPTQVVSVTGQPFARALRVSVPATRGDSNKIQLTIRNSAPIARGDALLAVFATRGQAARGAAQAMFLCEMEHPEFGSRRVEYFDGMNALSAELRSGGKDIALVTGRVSRDHAPAAGHPVKRRVLRLQSSLHTGERFCQAGTRRHAAAGAPVRLRLSSQQGPEQLTISAQHGRPLSYQTFDFWTRGDRGKDTRTKYTRMKGKPYRRVVLEGYRQFEGGVRFPSKVTVRVDKFTTVYELQKAVFNNAVSPDELHLPAMRVGDARFGYGPLLAIYQLKNGVLPSDGDVRRMVGLGEGDVVPPPAPADRLPFPPIIR